MQSLWAYDCSLSTVHGRVCLSVSAGFHLDGGVLKTKKQRDVVTIHTVFLRFWYIVRSRFTPHCVVGVFCCHDSHHILCGVGAIYSLVTNHTTFSVMLVQCVVANHTTFCVVLGRSVVTIDTTFCVVLGHSVVTIDTTFCVVL